MVLQQKKKITLEKCMCVIYRRGCIIIMGKCSGFIRIFCSLCLHKASQKAAPPHVLPREPRVTCGRVLRCWGERGREGGRRKTAVQRGATADWPL